MNAPIAPKELWKLESTGGAGDSHWAYYWACKKCSQRFYAGMCSDAHMTTPPIHECQRRDSHGHPILCTCDVWATTPNYCDEIMNGSHGSGCPRETRLEYVQRWVNPALRMEDTCQDHCLYGVACDCQGLHGAPAGTEA